MTSVPLLSKNCLNVWKKAERMGSRGTVSRPPIESIEYEMDLRGCVTELVN